MPFSRTPSWRRASARSSRTCPMSTLRNDFRFTLVKHATPFYRRKSMKRFDSYRNSFPNARLPRSKSGVLEVALHANGGTLVFNGYTHEQFVELFHAIGSDADN